MRKKKKERDIQMEEIAKQRDRESEGGREIKGVQGKKGGKVSMRQWSESLRERELEKERVERQRDRGPAFNQQKSCIFFANQTER